VNEPIGVHTMNERMVGYMEDTLDFTITGQNGWYLKID
jgi:hypothetical protein